MLYQKNRTKNVLWLHYLFIHGNMHANKTV